MKRISDKRGISIVELLGYTVLSAMVMSLLASMVYLFYKTNMRIGEQTQNTSANVLVYQNFQAEITRFSPQTATLLDNNGNVVNEENNVTPTSILLEIKKVDADGDGPGLAMVDIATDVESKMLIKVIDGKINIYFYSVDSYATSTPLTSKTFDIGNTCTISTLQFDLLVSKTGTTTNINIKGSVLNSISNTTSDFNFVIPFYSFISK